MSLSRETYDFTKLKNEEGLFDRNFIKSVSSARISYEYDVLTSEENPESPIVRYKSFVTRSISITDIELVGRWDLPEKASVYFTATETSKDGEINTSNWKSDVSFSMSDLEGQKNAKNTSPELRFTITTYSTKKLS